MKVLAGLYLGINAWTDWKRKEIDLRYTVAFCVAASLIFFARRQWPDWSGMIPGVCLWLISFWMGEKIGRGDGILTAALGCGVGLEQVMEVLINGFLLTGATGVILLISGRKGKEKIPFVPFLLCGFLIEEVLG